jgi:hypothetical protein
MTIRNCPNCGGDHFGSNKCPYRSAPCVICGADTILACSDCAIDSAGENSVHVCSRPECRDAHEKKHIKVEEMSKSTEYTIIEGEPFAMLDEVKSDRDEIRKLVGLLRRVRSHGGIEPQLDIEIDGALQSHAIYGD